MYLATSQESVSAVLLVEREKKQVPIYFVSRVLQGTELNYPELEKLTIALVHASRRFRRYFQAHPIVFLTDKPIRQILPKPEKSGRVTKWVIELGEHDIEFRARHSIKGQVLADFIAETEISEDPNVTLKVIEDERSEQW